RFGKKDSSGSHRSIVGNPRRRRQGRAGRLTNPPQPPTVPARPVGQRTVVGACQSVPMIQPPPEPGAGAEPPRRTLAATAAQTTAENPWPLRQLSVKVGEYVARMSPLWVEGEIVQFNRRPGAGISFMTLRDVDVDMSFPCRCASTCCAAWRSIR